MGQHIVRHKPTSTHSYRKVTYDSTFFSPKQYRDLPDMLAHNPISIDEQLNELLANRKEQYRELQRLGNDPKFKRKMEKAFKQSLVDNPVASYRYDINIYIPTYGSRNIRTFISCSYKYVQGKEIIHNLPNLDHLKSSDIKQIRETIEDVLKKAGTNHNVHIKLDCKPHHDNAIRAILNAIGYDEKNNRCSGYDKTWVQVHGMKPLFRDIATYQPTPKEIEERKEKRKEARKRTLDNLAALKNGTWCLKVKKELTKEEERERKERLRKKIEKIDRATRVYRKIYVERTVENIAERRKSYTRAGERAAKKIF